MSYVKSTAAANAAQPHLRPNFFGRFSMLREFWAEDPNWTDPGDGNTLTDIRDNGSLAADLTISTIGTFGVAPTYDATGINNLPSFRFNATADGVGGTAQTTSGTNGNDLTIGVVGKADALYSFSYFMDGRSATGARAIIGTILSGGKWRGYASSSLNVDPVGSDTNEHIFVLRAKTNDLELWVDNTSVGTDASGTLASFDGVVLGANQGLTASCLDGLISYAFMYNGDLQADAGFDLWISLIAEYYGITMA